MKTYIFFILIVFLFSNCRKEKIEIDQMRLSNEFNKIMDNEITDYIDNKFPANWNEQFKKVIQKEHPDIKFKSSDSLEYLIAPSLSIPIQKLNNYKGNFLNYLKLGKMKLDNSDLMLFKNDSLQIIFTIKNGYGMVKDGIYKSDANDYLRNIDLNTFKQSKFIFKINLTDGSGTFPIPGIILKTDNKLKIISTDGEIYPIEEFYKINWKTRDEFDKYISITVEAAEEFRSSSN